MASIQARTLKALLGDTEYCVQGDIQSEQDLTQCLHFVVGEDENGMALTEAYDPNSADYSPFTYAEYSAKYAEIEADQPTYHLRIQRNQLLAQCDWTQAADSPLDDATKAEWATYRQALRDITNTYSSLEDVVFPEKP
jgi:hypothetical protein